MKEIIFDTLIDAVKLLPFLFITFLVMEFIEHNFNKKTKNKIINAGKYGPIIGGLLGAVPQCGFSVMATNLYATRIISLGTLISIYLSTSDEMLPILISNGANALSIFSIIGLKIIIGMACGFIIDFVIRKENFKKANEITKFCDESHCNCKHGILKSSIKHTINILLFIILITFLLNVGINFLGKNAIEKLFLKNSFLSPFISSLIGLIPNCASSVFLTQLYIDKIISFSSCLAGLLTGTGVAILVLFKVNKNVKDNVKILTILYLIGSFFGLFMQFLNNLI